MHDNVKNCGWLFVESRACTSSVVFLRRVAGRRSCVRFSLSCRVRVERSVWGNERPFFPSRSPTPARSMSRCDTLNTCTRSNINQVAQTDNHPLPGNQTTRGPRDRVDSGVKSLRREPTTVRPFAPAPIVERSKIGGRSWAKRRKVTPSWTRPVGSLLRLERPSASALVMSVLHC